VRRISHLRSRYITATPCVAIAPLHTRLESAIIFQRRRPSIIHYSSFIINCRGVTSARQTRIYSKEKG
ncbi:MAG: hypothetical protein UH249_04335, partial [Acutalibacteraceae bacterium]|nr:hypothetical protein [Acutalibacteraceae bacterium]